MSASTIVCSRAGHVATLTIRRPGRSNALRRIDFAELVAQLRAAGADPQVRVIVLTGEGERAFCAGADLDDSEPFFTGAVTGLGEWLRAARSLDAWLVARVNGACIGGGLGLLAACDLSIAREDARFALPELTRGLYPFVVAAAWRGRIAEAHLARLTLGGETIDAATAERMGFIARAVAPSTLDGAIDAAVERLCALPRASVAPARRRDDDADFEARLAAAERSLAERLADARAGAGAPDANGSEQRAGPDVEPLHRQSARARFDVLATGGRSSGKSK